MAHQQGYFTRPVEGRRAPRYLLIEMVSFAVTVVAVRSYLELTGYPQIGNDTFHIAHALWGGLLLLIAASLPLIYLNTWIFTLSSVLTGVGIGLFIDEIGKFITQSNDYFFPLAAPIIYVVYVLIVLAYLRVRHNRRRDTRTEMYIALEEMKELLDQRFDVEEKSRLVIRLKKITRQTDRPDLSAIAQAMIEPIQGIKAEAPKESTTPWGRLLAWLKRIEDRYFTQKVMRRMIGLVLGWLGIVSIIKITTLAFLIIHQGSAGAPLLGWFMEGVPLVRGTTSLISYLMLIVIEVVCGVLYVTGAQFLLRERDEAGVRISTVGLIVSLTFGHTLAFYFNQFSVILDSIGLLIVLLMLIRYRDRFVHRESLRDDGTQTNAAVQARGL
jgi:hypothetical protein